MTKTEIAAEQDSLNAMLAMTETEDCALSDAEVENIVHIWTERSYELAEMLRAL